MVGRRMNPSQRRSERVSRHDTNLAVETEDKVDDDGEEEHDGKNGGTESVVVGT